MKLLAALAIALVVAGNASAALFDDDEARKRIADTNVRLTQVQRQLEDRLLLLETQLKAQGLVEMLGTVEGIKADISRLRRDGYADPFLPLEEGVRKTLGG